MQRIWSLLFLAVLGAAGYHYYVTLSRADLPEASYRLARIERGDIIAAVTASGAINPTSTIIVGTQMSGLVIEVLADFNSEVKAGAVIARLDATQVKAKLDGARADLAQAQAQARVQRASVQKNLADTDRARALLTDAESQVARVDVLVADVAQTMARQNELRQNGVATAVTVQAAKTAVDTAKAQRASAVAQVGSARAAIASLEADRAVAEAQIAAADAGALQKQALVRQIEVDLANTDIRSPVNGTVVQRTIELGQTVAASLQTPTLFQIAQDLREMEIYANIDEADVGRVQPGQAVTFTVNAWPGRNFDGVLKLVRLGSQNVQNVVIYTAIITVKNPRLDLKPGMTANLRILTDKRENVLRLPNSALRWKPAGTPAEPAASQNAGGGLLGAPAAFPSTQPQGGGNGQRANAEFADAIKAEVKPDAGQQEQIDALFSKSRGQFAQIASGETDAAVRRERMRSLREEMAGEIAALLSPPQRVLFAGLRERMTANRAAFSQGQSGRVFVVANGKPEAVPLRLGASDGAFTEILAGALEDKREVIVGGGAKPGASGILPGPPPGGRAF